MTVTDYQLRLLSKNISGNQIIDENISIDANHFEKKKSINQAITITNSILWKKRPYLTQSWGNWDTEIKITSHKEVDYVISLIKQAFDNVIGVENG